MLVVFSAKHYPVLHTEHMIKYTLNAKTTHPPTVKKARKLHVVEHVYSTMPEDVPESEPMLSVRCIFLP